MTKPQACSAGEDRAPHRRWGRAWCALALVLAIAGALVVGLAQEGTFAEDQQAVIDVFFPPDPVEIRDAIVSGCTQCHGLGLTIFVVEYFDADRWVTEIDAHTNRGDMRVARMRDADLVQAVTEYLQKYFVMGRELPEEVPDWIIGVVEAY